MSTRENLDDFEIPVKCIGAIVGLGVGIWVVAKFVQPALADADGISKAGADAITAAIALFGGLDLTMLAGVLGLAITFVALAYCLNCTYSCLDSACSKKTTVQERPLIEGQSRVAYNV